MINFFKDPARNSTVVSYRLEDTLAEKMDGALARTIVNQLSDMWIEKHGKELLDTLSPHEVSNQIKDLIAVKITKSLVKE